SHGFGGNYSGDRSRVRLKPESSYDRRAGGAMWNDGRYSCRSATIGSTVAARRAGTQHATAATTINSSGTPPNTDRNSGPRTRWRLTKTAIAHPIIAPAATTRRVSARILPTRPLVVAPSARRTPISLVRCDTVYATTA